MSHFISLSVSHCIGITDNNDGKSVKVPHGGEQEKARYSWISAYFPQPL